ncbi:MAG: pyruvate kinase [Pseudomonadota bacterium]
MTAIRLSRGRRAKIIATLGPSSRAPDMVTLLAQAGVDIFRLNFSHGTHDDHAKSLQAVRHAEDKLGRPLAVLADLQGPKIRVGTFPDGAIRLSMGQELELVFAEAATMPGTIAVPHREILAQLEPDDEILLNDGQLRLTVLAGGERPVVKSDLPGRLSDKKGFTVRGKALAVDAMTAKDQDDLAFALEMGIDLVALSFVQSVEDITRAKTLIAGRAPLIAKIEKPAAVDDLHEVVCAADAVMVARGDLGVEYPLEEVPVIQRQIIRAARSAGRPVIVATQMLESMIEQAAPTRAEVGDVATAVYQGADAVMLSAETAIGRHPATVVAISDRIIKATERAEDYAATVDQFDGAGPPERDKLVDVVADAVQSLASDHGADVLALRTGAFHRLARFSRIRGPVPILYGSSDVQRLRQAQILWGVHPIQFDGEVTDEWAAYLARRSGHDGRYAYARWRGVGDGTFAWEIGTSGYAEEEG